MCPGQAVTLVFSRRTFQWALAQRGCMCPGQAVTWVFSRRIFQWASCVRPTESRPDLHSSSTAPRSFARSPSAHLRAQAVHRVALTVLPADAFWGCPQSSTQLPAI